jgi:hypothetical protein
VTRKSRTSSGKHNRVTVEPVNNAHQFAQRVDVLLKTRPDQHLGQLATGRKQVGTDDQLLREPAAMAGLRDGECSAEVDEPLVGVELGLPDALVPCDVGVCTRREHRMLADANVAPAFTMQARNVSPASLRHSLGIPSSLSPMSR